MGVLFNKDRPIISDPSIDGFDFMKNKAAERIFPPVQPTRDELGDLGIADQKMHFFARKKGSNHLKIDIFYLSKKFAGPSDTIRRPREPSSFVDLPLRRHPPFSGPGPRDPLRTWSKRAKKGQVGLH